MKIVSSLEDITQLTAAQLLLEAQMKNDYLLYFRQRLQMKVEVSVKGDTSKRVTKKYTREERCCKC